MTKGLHRALTNRISVYMYSCIEIRSGKLMKNLYVLVVKRSDS